MLRYYAELLKDFRQVPGAAIVYGSVSTGTARVDSDIDVAVIGGREAKQRAEDIADDIFFESHRVVSVTWLTPEFVANNMHRPFVQRVLNGEVIHGREIIEGIGR